MTNVEALNYFNKRKHQFGLSKKARRAEEMAILALEQQINKRTITLPCGINDTFYIIAQKVEHGKYDNFFVDERKVTCFLYNGKEIAIYNFDNFDGMVFFLDEVFLDREKAKARAWWLNKNENKKQQTFN